MAGTGGTMTYGAALRRLRGAQKTAKGVSLYSRYVNRPVGRLLAAAAYRAGLGPNQVTALSALTSGAAIAAVALAAPSAWLALAVWAGLFLGFALDSADGQLARLRGESNPAGEWLDHAVDCAKITALHAAVLISFHRFFALPGEGWLLVPLVFQLAAVLIFFGGLLTDKLKHAHPAPAAPAAAPAAPPSRRRALALLPADYGVLCALFLLLGDERAFRTGYAVLCAVYVLFCAAFSVKWFRELSALKVSSTPRS
ncbi:CDP-alcohol phosphatidyltransferase family protein [Streptomyces johnsoniae]|uniref:CDP-alcohol phosphatidyltransferase family protein n=1 Tax=Streptomyces johnsoniae TaxID=3075532 RepID=A0ABU2S742_9ACTN|nr:CDP-alcohol phosphatidyltransferase family protein [Streptomyces sp. DSM 41886]MDT0444229.1 CDP-alcohol phosphatidyltransferase family protein [Streptomyces sp. DSM 41886]